MQAERRGIFQGRRGLNGVAPLDLSEKGQNNICGRHCWGWRGVSDVGRGTGGGE